MATNKFFKSLLFASTIAVSVFGSYVPDSSAYPVFAQQNYSNPRAANGNKDNIRALLIAFDNFRCC